MKKNILLLSIILCLFNNAKACEICGCGLGNYYIGLLPQFNHHFFGLRYQYRNFDTQIAGTNGTQFSHDYYKTVELWAGWNIGKRWQVLAIIPYNYIHQVTDDGISNNQGIGDIATMVNYKVFDTRTTTKNGKNILQQFWVGAGIKLPTGKFNVDASATDLIAQANAQTGSGSTDFMLNAMYNLKINKWGINTGTSYKLNSSNSDKYHFGNKFSVNSLLSYTINKPGFVMLPNAGLTYEKTTLNTLDKIAVAQTGGYLFSSTAGVELSIKKITIGANVQLPINQNFAMGQTNLKVKGMVHITYSF